MNSTLFLLMFLLGTAFKFCVGKCKDLTEPAILNLLNEWKQALRTGKTSNVVDMYRKEDPLLLATLDNKPLTTPAELAVYFDSFLLKSPDFSLIDTFSFLPGNVLAGLYNFHVNVFSDTCAPSKCGPTTVTRCTRSCRTDVPARFTFFYTCEKDKWKIAHHHSSMLPITANAGNETAHRMLRGEN